MRTLPLRLSAVSTIRFCAQNKWGCLENDDRSEYALTMRTQIALAEKSHMPAWLSLASELEPLFGPMPDFEIVLKRKILRKQAYCALVESNGLHFAAGVLIGGSGNEHWIRWLGVYSQFRQSGVGSSLVEAVLQRIPPTSDVFVDTFVAGSPGGKAARHLYMSFGFKPVGPLEIEGQSRDRLKKLAVR